MLTLLSKPSQNEHDLLSFSLDELAQLGAKRILKQALELEVKDYITRHTELTGTDGKRLVVRNGRSRKRKVTIGSGTVEILAPRINDRRLDKKFVSNILPPYLKKSANVETILPLLYLKGLSGNAFYESLNALLGEDAGGLKKSSIALLKRSWGKELEAWKKMPITDEFVYIWADGVNVSVRLGEDKKLCLLVLIGVNQDGEKKLLAVEAGYRESKDSWTAVFNDLISRGLNSPLVIIGDGALGLWSAVRSMEHFKHTKEQRCWFHKLGNILDKFPKRVQPRAKKSLYEMMRAEKEADAIVESKKFQTEFHKKYPKAVKCLVDDWDELTSFFSFPAEHWKHIRTSNPIESAFATVKLRTKVTKGAGSLEVAETFAFKLLYESQKRWKKIKGFREIPNLLNGVLYKDGEILEGSSNQKVVA